MPIVIIPNLTRGRLDTNEDPQDQALIRLNELPNPQDSGLDHVDLLLFLSDQVSLVVHWGRRCECGRGGRGAGDASIQLNALDPLYKAESMLLTSGLNQSIHYS